MVSSSSSPSLSLHHHHHRHRRGRTVTESLMFLVTVLVSTASMSLVCSSVVPVAVVVASFSPSPTSSTCSNTSSGRSSVSRGLFDRTANTNANANPTFGGNSGTSAKENKPTTTTTSKANVKVNVNEGIEQNSKAYTRLYEKSVPPREVKQEKVTVENENETETVSTASSSMTAASEFSEEESNDMNNAVLQNKDMNDTQEAGGASEKLSNEAKQRALLVARLELDMAVEAGTSEKLSNEAKQRALLVARLELELEQQRNHKSDNKQQPEEAEQQSSPSLSSQLLSKDAMYQNQIDALTEQAANDIHQLETNLVVLQHEYNSYQSKMTEQLRTTVLTASEKEHALFQEMTTLLSKLEDEQQAVVQSVRQAEELQQEIAALQNKITAMQLEYADTLADLEDDYEMEQNARAKEQAEHVSELLRIRQEAVTHVEAVERGANEHTELARVEYSRQKSENQQVINSIQVQLTHVQQSLRDREDLIAEWAADRASAKTLSRQLWQLLKGRVVARARRIKSRLTLWFSDEAP